jgi:hypothetical protein
MKRFLPFLWIVTLLTIISIPLWHSNASDPSRSSIYARPLGPALSVIPYPDRLRR